MDHLQCVLMAETGRAPHYHSPLTALSLSTLYLRASFSEVMREDAALPRSLGRSQVGGEPALLRCSAAAS